MNFKDQEKLSNYLRVLIKHKLKTLQNLYKDLRGILERLGITFERYSETSDSNVFLKDETSNDKNKEMKTAPDLFQVSGTTCSGSEISKTFGVDTTGSGVIYSSSDETETDNSMISSSDCESDESDALSTLIALDRGNSNIAIKSSDSYSDTSSSSCEIDEYYYDGDTLDGFSETTTNTVRYDHPDPELYLTADQAWEALQLEMLSSENPDKIYDEFVSYHNLSPCGALQFSGSDARSLYSEIQIPAIDKSSFLGNRLKNDILHESRCIDQEATMTEQGSSHRIPALARDRVPSVTGDDLKKTIIGIALDSVELQFKNFKHRLCDSKSSVLKNHPGTSVTSDETEVRKEMSPNLIISDDEWDNLSLAMKHDKDPIRNLSEFLTSSDRKQYEALESSDRDPEFCDSDWKLSESHEESHMDERSRIILKRLKAIRSLLTKHNIPPSQYNVDMEIMSNPEAAVIEELSDSDDDESLSTSPDQTTEYHPDTLNNIFTTTLKYHPLKKFEIPPYASANADRTLDITGRKLDSSCTKDEDEDMSPNKIDILKACISDNDSPSFMSFEFVHSFNNDSNVTCDVLIKEYQNTVFKVNMFLIKKAKDVSSEEYELRIATLLRLDNELGYLSARLIATRREWDKQFRQMKQISQTNEQSGNRKYGLFYMGTLRVCINLSEILFKFCLEKTLELEDYEKDLIFHHERRK